MSSGYLHTSVAILTACCLFKQIEKINQFFLLFFQLVTGAAGGGVADSV
jgi:hypothetical protein